ncbi:MAG: translation initiation factor IF-2 [Verrucomicrobia bacterium]|nr:translation initiation factor IF-2 [Verrucomicrobiota bacterium]MBI3870733.1 translation initiation factor IF-2 [Verrucomicrobiota bacterium]
MPVRIYDLAKKLGIESKEVIAKAKELGISAAKVASSSLDKITAEYLEDQLTVGRPRVDSLGSSGGHASTAEVAPPPEPEAPPQIQLIKAPPVEIPSPVAASSSSETVAARPPGDAHDPVLISADPLLEARGSESLTEPSELSPLPIQAKSQEHAVPSDAAAASPAIVPLAPPPSAPPQPPAGPKLGDKVGFIQLPLSGRGGPRDRAATPPAPAPRGSAPPMARPGMDRGGRPGGQGYGQGRPGGGFPQRGPAQGYSQQRPGFGGSPQRPAAPAAPAAPLTPSDAPIVTIKPPIIVRELAEKMGIKPFRLIADLIDLKVMATVNQAVDESIAQRVCAKHGFRFEVEKRKSGSGVTAPKQELKLDQEDRTEDLKPRAPVVTIMGHVDHGKTTLLDTIRKANVASGEAGGITQHIGAYTIAVPHPERKDEMAQITFLDTPGHAAFSAMRARGANVTDLVILVVAANDGVMPQTLEALSHAQAAKVPILVAVNKCDHPNANTMKVRQQLQEKGLVPDEWGGSTLFVDVSGLTGTGVPKLLEMVLFQADLLELRANPNRLAKGNVIESGLEPGGPTATVLVRKGTLRLGEAVICGPFWGKVRALISEEGKRLKEAGPSVAVRVLGLSGVPEAGLEFSAVEDEKAARELAEERSMQARADAQQQPSAKATLEDLFGRIEEASAKALKVVVKADTQGSVEAIVEALRKIESNRVNLEIVHHAVGTVTSNDVTLASASRATILGFHTRIDGDVSDLAKHEGVQIKLYSIIYELIDEVKKAMAGLLPPIIKENVIGSAEIRQIFELSKGGNVAGCMVTSGRVVRGKLRVMRKKNRIYEGVSLSLRRFQDEVNEVRAGMECGIRLDGFNEFVVGDVVECYVVEKLTPEL